MSRVPCHASSREFWRCLGEEDAKCSRFYIARAWERLDECLERAEKTCLERLGDDA